ncbi:MAG: hypothetical protein HN361_07965, partial [Actinobacteria bacterium]|nr:hypothetical protein [Actinomycetota bacterium]
SSGALDSTFGTGGIVTVDVGSKTDKGYGVAIQSDGKIVVVGESATDPMGFSYDFLAIRLSSSGSLDSTFGTAGIATIALGPSSDYARSVVIDSSGRAVIGGYASNGVDWDFGIVRLTTSGGLDSAFNGGTVLVPFGSNDYAYGMVLASDGDVILAGTSGGDFAVARLTSSGVLDTAFSGDGRATVDVGAGDDTARAAALATDGDIILAGFSGGDVAVVRLTSGGSLDATFAGSGATTFAVGAGNDAAYAVAVTARGRLVLAGSAHNGTDDDVAVLRLTSAGLLDTSFSGDGKLTHGVSGNDVAYGVDATSSGRIVIGGDSATRFLAMAFEGATIPDAPTGLAATTGDQQVALSWSAPADDGGASVSGYDVEVSSDAGASWVTALAGHGSVSATVTGLTNGVEYVFRVAAVNAAGTGSTSTTATATPAGAPAAPTGLAAAAGEGTADLSWSAPADDGGASVSGYDVEVSSDAGASWVTALAGHGSVSATVTGLTNGVDYLFRVAAVNAAGTGSTSATATATPYTVPGAPSALASTPSDQSVALAWDAPANNGGRSITGYRIERSVDGGANWSVVMADTASANTSATVTGLLNGLTYAFRLAAHNLRGTGPVSATVQTQPTAPPTTTTTTVPTASTTTLADQPTTTTIITTQPEEENEEYEPQDGGIAPNPVWIG